MKHSIVFNHDADDVASAVGTNIDDVSTAVSNLVRKYITEDKHTKRSHLCEMVANELSTEIIVFLASQKVFEGFEELEADLKKFSQLKALFGED